MSGHWIFAGLFGAFGGLVWLGAGYGLYRLYLLQQVPLKAPDDVENGETVALEGHIRQDTPTITAPFSGESAPIVYWRISRWRAMSEDSNWIQLEHGVRNPPELFLDVEGYAVTVALPDSIDYADLPSLGHGNTGRYTWQRTIDENEAPPTQIADFEAANDLRSVDDTDSNTDKRRYIEDGFAAGDSVTVHGEVTPEDGSTVSATNVQLTPDGHDFLVTGRKRSAVVKRRVLGTALATVVGSILIAAALLGL